MSAPQTGRVVAGGPQYFRQPTIGAPSRVMRASAIKLTNDAARLLRERAVWPSGGHSLLAAAKDHFSGPDRTRRAPAFGSDGARGRRCRRSSTSARPKGESSMNCARGNPERAFALQKVLEWLRLVDWPRRPLAPHEAERNQQMGQSVSGRAQLPPTSTLGAKREAACEAA